MFARSGSSDAIRAAPMPIPRLVDSSQTFDCATNWSAARETQAAGPIEARSSHLIVVLETQAVPDSSASRHRLRPFNMAWE